MINPLKEHAVLLTTTSFDMVAAAIRDHGPLVSQVLEALLEDT